MAFKKTLAAVMAMMPLVFASPKTYAQGEISPYDSNYHFISEITGESNSDYVFGTNGPVKKSSHKTYSNSDRPFRVWEAGVLVEVQDEKTRKQIKKNLDRIDKAREKVIKKFEKENIAKKDHGNQAVYKISDKEKAESVEHGKKYGPREPLELSIKSYSKESAGKTPASQSGYGMTLEASLNKTSFGTKIIPELKDLFYGSLEFKTTTGDGKIPKIGKVSQDDDNYATVAGGFKFFGEEDMFMYAGYRIKSGSHDQTVKFSNSRTINGLTTSMHGSGAELGFNSRRFNAVWEYLAENGSTKQELTRNNAVLANESNRFHADSFSLKAYAKPTDNLWIDAHYDHRHGRYFDGTNNVSSRGFGIKATLPESVRGKLSKGVAEILGNTSFNISNNYESGERYSATTWTLGATYRFKNFHLPGSDAKK